MAANQFLASQAGIARLYGALAQLGERNAGSVEVIGSIPIGSTNFIRLLLFPVSGGLCTGLNTFSRHMVACRRDAFHSRFLVACRQAPTLKRRSDP